MLNTNTRCYCHCLTYLKRKEKNTTLIVTFLLIRKYISIKMDICVLDCGDQTHPIVMPSCVPQLPLWRSSSFGPSSLGSSLPPPPRAPPPATPSWRTSRQSTQLRSLETNLHKILARKIADSEEVSFRKAKLLTKAYYRLLRSDSSVGKVVANEVIFQMRVLIELIQQVV